MKDTCRVLQVLLCLLACYRASSPRICKEVQQEMSIGMQGLSLPLKMEDKQMLDLVIKKTLTLKGRVAVMLGSVAPLQVLFGFYLSTWVFFMF